MILTMEVVSEGRCCPILNESEKHWKLTIPPMTPTHVEVARDREVSSIIIAANPKLVVVKIEKDRDPAEPHSSTTAGSITTVRI
jgi:hypothetical protein